MSVVLSQDNQDNSETLWAAGGTVLAGLAAMFAAFKKFGRDEDDDEDRPATKKKPGAPADRSERVVEAAWKLIDELQEQNQSLSDRCRSLEEQRQRNEHTIDELRTRLARGSPPRRSRPGA